MPDFFFVRSALYLIITTLKLPRLAPTTNMIQGLWKAIMAKLFSERSNEPSTAYTYTISTKARQRILHSISALKDGFYNSLDWNRTLHELEEFLNKKNGGFSKSVYDHSRQYNVALPIMHFAEADDTAAIDFLEAVFQVFHNPRQQGVEIINNIFEEEHIGYYLTPYIETITDEPGSMFGRAVGRKLDIQHPKVVKKDSEFLHAQAVQPAVELLKGAKYKGANEEFVKAHEYFRKKDYKACLNECLKTFESVMKIICHHKKWTHSPTATAQPLIKTCLENGLIPTFTEQQLTSLRMLLESGVPTVRNKQGGHGQGVQPIDVSPEVAQYALNTTASVVTLLAGSAKL